MNVLRRISHWHHRHIQLTRWAISIIAAFIIATLGINGMMIVSTQKKIYTSVQDVPAKQTALILGARVYNNVTASRILQDRLRVGAQLYTAGKVSKIIVSGDHGRTTYDEVNTMRKYLTDAGVPKKDIFMDHAGFDTYDSVYRSKAIFGVDSLIIVSQQFHLPRALYIADKRGIDAVGISADLHTYPLSTRLRNNLREFFSRIKAFADVHLDAMPHFLGELIPITGDGTVTEG